MNETQKGSSLRQQTPEQKAAAQANMNLRLAAIAARDANQPKIRELGEDALRRLMPIARRDTGQSGVVARFLLNLYNGDRFPFDNTDLRRLDFDLFDDCMAVLRMDSQLSREVHLYFDPDGGQLFELLAKDWGFKDYAGSSWKK